MAAKGGDMKRFGRTAGEPAGRIAPPLGRWDDRVIGVLRPRILGALAVAALAAAAASCGGESESKSESAAGAALPGLVRVRDYSALDSVSPKKVFPACPAGKQLTGAGGRNDQAGAGLVGIDEITPIPDLSGVTVIAVETGAGTSSSWRVRGYGICETSTALHGLEIANAESAIDSTGVKSVTAVCPSGKKVVGTGGQISSDPGKAVVGSIVPVADLSGVTATGVETAGGTTNNWLVDAWAICGTAASIPGLQRVSATSAVDSSAAKSIFVICPAGTKLTGGGGQIRAAPSEWPKIVLEGIALAGTLDRVGVYGAETGGGTTSSWGVVAFAICASP
jgi:hypothetical protein